jgi:hypothetical protein
VTLKAQPPVEYTPDRLKIENSTASGRWRQFWHDIDNDYVEHPWHATNYYMYPGVYQLHKAEMDWMHCGTYDQLIIDTAEEDGYTAVTAGWELEDQVDGHVNYQTCIENWRYDMFAELKVNERAGVPCFTHVLFDESAGHQSRFVTRGDVWFQFWDIYGNQGKFYSRVSGDRKGIEFHVKT